MKNNFLLAVVIHSRYDDDDDDYEEDIVIHSGGDEITYGEWRSQPPTSRHHTGRPAHSLIFVFYGFSVS